MPRNTERGVLMLLAGSLLLLAAPELWRTASRHGDPRGWDAARHGIRRVDPTTRDFATAQFRRQWATAVAVSNAAGVTASAAGLVVPLPHGATQQALALLTQRRMPNVPMRATVVVAAAEVGNVCVCAALVSGALDSSPVVVGGAYCRDRDAAGRRGSAPYDRLVAASGGTTDERVLLADPGSDIVLTVAFDPTTRAIAVTTAADRTVVAVTAAVWPAAPQLAVWIGRSFGRAAATDATILAAAPTVRIRSITTDVPAATYEARLPAAYVDGRAYGDPFMAYPAGSWLLPTPVAGQVRLTSDPATIPLGQPLALVLFRTPGQRHALITALAPLDIRARLDPLLAFVSQQQGGDEARIEAIIAPAFLPNADGDYAPTVTALAQFAANAGGAP